jgi:signal transduction histidine kinase
VSAGGGGGEQRWRWPGRRVADRWQLLTIRRRILTAMLAVSVIPLAVVSAAGITALQELNSGALQSANQQLVAAQGTHLQELVDSKATGVNDELAAIESQVTLVGKAAQAELSSPGPGLGTAGNASTFTVLGSSGASSAALAAGLHDLAGLLTEIPALHHEVADAWINLPQYGLLGVSPATAVSTADRSRFEQLLPSAAVYQAGIAEVAAADQLQSSAWRQLISQSPQTAVWTPVYSNPLAGGPTVTVATQGTTAAGIEFQVGANITVSNLVSTFLAGPPGSAQGSYGFLLSPEGNVISVGARGTAALGLPAHRRPTEPVSLTQHGDPWLPVATQMRLGLQGSGQITLDGDPVDVFYSPLPTTQWSYGVALPVSGLDASVVGFSQEISRGLAGAIAILIPILLLLAGLVLVFTNLLSRRLLGPLARLRDASERLASGDLDTAVAVSPGPADEIGGLELSLDGLRRRLAEQRAQIRAAREELERRVSERTAELGQRNQELATLNTLTSALGRSLVVSELAMASAAQLQAVWQLPGVWIYVADQLDPSGLRLVGMAGPESEEPPPAAREGYSAQAELLLLPLAAAGAEVGLLVLRGSGPFNHRQRELLEVVGGQLGLALRNAQLFVDTQELATINERNRIAREIHDTLAQGLAGIIVQLQASEAWMGRESDRAQEALRRATELARSSLQEARRSVWDLRPEGLQRAGLAGAIRDELARVRERSGIRTSLRLRGLRGLTLPAQLEVTVFRIVREAVGNAVRHGSPAEVTVELSWRQGTLQVVVSDDGRGFEPTGPARPGSFGVTSMRERAAAAGGELELNSRPGEGTRVVLQVPCPRAEVAR